MWRFRHTRCQETVDRAYFLLNFDHEAALVPDYNVSASRLWRGLTAQLFATGLGPWLLCQAALQVSDKDKIPSLPSWAFDFGLPFKGTDGGSGTRYLSGDAYMRPELDSNNALRCTLEYVGDVTKKWGSPMLAVAGPPKSSDFLSSAGNKSLVAAAKLQADAVLLAGDVACVTWTVCNDVLPDCVLIILRPHETVQHCHRLIGLADLPVLKERVTRSVNRRSWYGTFKTRRRFTLV